MVKKNFGCNRITPLPFDAKEKLIRKKLSFV